MHEEPLFVVGLFADIQYGDIDDYDERKFYRNGVVQAQRIVQCFNAKKPAFAVNLGDLIEGQCAEEQAARDLQRILSELDRLELPLRHVLGNHCLSSLPRPLLHTQLHLADTDNAYYAFTHASHRLVVLDTQQISVCGTTPGSTRRALAEDALRQLSGDNILDWNGKLDADQLAWLQAELRAAAAQQQRVIVFWCASDRQRHSRRRGLGSSHIPLVREATSARHLLWEPEPVLAVLDQFSNIDAVICGHYHKGGYARRNGVHHVTLKGALEVAVCLVGARGAHSCCRRPKTKSVARCCTCLPTNWCWKVRGAGVINVCSCNQPTFAAASRTGVGVMDSHELPLRK